MDNTQGLARDVIDQLQRPIFDISTLLGLLSGPLDSLGLLPPQFGRYNNAQLPQGAISVSRHVPSIQRALLEHIVPTWDTALVDENATLLLEQYFCPDSFSFASPMAGEVALLAYSTILSQPLTVYAIHLLARLTAEYPVDRLHTAIFSRKTRDQEQMLAWEDCIRNVVVVPGKVANMTAGKIPIPPLLEHGTYYDNVCVRCESLIFSLSSKGSKGMFLRFVATLH